jgi:hypothetical protein
VQWLGQADRRRRGIQQCQLLRREPEAGRLQEILELPARKHGDARRCAMYLVACLQETDPGR